MIDKIMITAKNTPRVYETPVSCSFMPHLSNFLDTYDTEYYHSPLANVSETDEHISIEIALPGISLRDVIITVDDEYLIVNSNPDSRNRMQFKKFNKREYNTACFFRAVKLPAEASGRQFLKYYNNGMLLIMFPKKEYRIQTVKERLPIKQRMLKTPWLNNNLLSLRKEYFSFLQNWGYKLF